MGYIYCGNFGKYIKEKEERKEPHLKVNTYG